MTKYYQACFSRLGGNDMSAGWQSFHVSPGMPVKVKEVFERAERNNQPAGYETPRDKDGKPLCMLEIISDGSSVGISKVQYGLSDSFGRENMFCHGFLVQNAYDVLKNPAELLYVADSNFRFTPEETKDIPEAPVLDSAPSLEEALNKCGMNKDAYVTLISCAYSALSTNAKSTIYIKTDGSDEMARNLLFLIYNAVPYCLRGKITASTYLNNAQNSMFVFTPNPPESGKYIEPASGENNIMTTILQNRWKRYPFVAYYAQNFDTLDGKAFYDAIEAGLSSMGDPYLKDMDAIRLAFSMVSKVEGADAAGLLYDWMVLPVPNNPTLEHSVAELLKEVIAQDTELGKETEDLLMQRLESAESEELKLVGYRYQAAQLMRKTAKEACASLLVIPPKSPVFGELRSILAGETKGLEILSEYYQRKEKELASGSGMSYRALGEFTYTFSDLSGMEEVWDSVTDSAAAIARREIYNGGNYRAAEYGLRQFLSDYYPQADTPDMYRSLQDLFDRRFREDFKSERMADYEAFYQQDFPGAYPLSQDRLSKYQSVRDGYYLDVLDITPEGYVTYGSTLPNEKERRQEADSVFNYAFECGAAQNCRNILFWEQMAAAVQEDLVGMMMENEVVLFCDADALAEALETDRDWTDERIEAVMDNYYSYIEDRQDNPYKKNMDVLARELKRRADEEKRNLKEQRRQERMDRDAERQMNKRKGKEEPVDYYDDEEPQELSDEWFDKQAGYEPEQYETQNRQEGFLSGITKLFGRGGKNKK